MIHLHRITNNMDYYIHTVEMEELVSFIVKQNNSYFLDVLHQALLHFREHQDYIKNFQSQKKRLVNRRRERVEDTTDFLELLKNVLNLSNEENHYPGKRKPYSKEESYRNIRGAILEALVIEVVGKLRYEEEYASWVDDCKVQRLPEKQTICFYYKDGLTYRTKQNIDIAAWSSNKGGEFYECKLSPSGFKKENIEYLQQIYSHIQEVDKSLLSSSSFGGITLDTTTQLELKVKSIVKGWFIPVGRDRLFELGKSQLLS